MTLVITGAGGHLGRLTAEILLEQVEPGELVLVTRRPEALADLAARGAEVRHGDFEAPDSLARAFAGVQRLLLISSDAIGAARVAQHENAIEAARAAGVRHISYTSIPNPSDGNPAGVVPDHKATEEAIATTGLPWTALRNALYAEFRLPEATAAAASGSFAHNLGKGTTAFVSRADCAAAAAAVLSGGPEHDRIAYDITGPELVGADDLAAVYARLSGREVTAESVTDAELNARLVAAGVPELGARLAVSFGEAIRDRQLDQCSTAVQDLTGRPPRSLESVLAAELEAAAA